MAKPDSKQRFRVLVVDDHAISRQHLLAALPLTGRGVLAAHTAEEAIELASLCLPQLVFMDIRLPDRDGLDTMRAIRRCWPACEPLPYFVVVSADDLTSRAEELVELGVSAVLQKPVTAEQIRELIAARTGAPSSPPADRANREYLYQLFRDELRQRLPELDHHLFNQDLRQASELVHMLLASSAMAGERELEAHLRQLSQLLLHPESPSTLAGAYLKAVEQANLCLG